MTAVPLHIPFVGPRPLRGGEPLIGRTEDLQRLLDELIARRVVVLHSAAGAGKGSLIHAGLIPAMQKAGFDVWKPIVLNPDISEFADLPDNIKPVLAENPFVRFYNGQRGYVTCELTAKQARADFKVVEFVTERGAPNRTRASFVVEDGRPGAVPA